MNLNSINSNVQVCISSCTASALHYGLWLAVRHCMTFGCWQHLTRSGWLPTMVPRRCTCMRPLLFSCSFPRSPRVEDDAQDSTINLYKSRQCPCPETTTKVYTLRELGLIVSQPARLTSPNQSQVHTDSASTGPAGFEPHSVASRQSRTVAELWPAACSSPRCHLFLLSARISSLLVKVERQFRNIWAGQ